MSFALLIIGIVMVTAAVRGTHQQLIQLVGGDFEGQGNFIYWIAALLLIGAVGYVKSLKEISDGFLALVILVLLLSKGNPNASGGGFFQQLKTQLSGTSGGGTITSGINTVLGAL